MWNKLNCVNFKMFHEFQDICILKNDSHNCYKGMIKVEAWDGDHGGATHPDSNIYSICYTPKQNHCMCSKLDKLPHTHINSYNLPRVTLAASFLFSSTTDHNIVIVLIHPTKEQYTI